jgi:hypothetical protein
VASICCLSCCPLKIRPAGEKLYPGSTSSNASNLTGDGRCFPFPEIPKATTPGTLFPTAAVTSSGVVTHGPRVQRWGIAARQVWRDQRVFLLTGSRSQSLSSCFTGGLRRRASVNFRPGDSLARCAPVDPIDLTRRLAKLALSSGWLQHNGRRRKRVHRPA